MYSMSNSEIQKFKHDFPDFVEDVSEALNQPVGASSSAVLGDCDIDGQSIICHMYWHDQSQHYLLLEDGKVYTADLEVSPA